MTSSTSTLDYTWDEAYELNHLDDTNLTSVEVDGLVIMRMIKHSRENLPQLVTGQLLGLDIKSTLQVTDCVPFPKIEEADDENEEETEDDSDAKGAEYQLEMMLRLREVNVDNNIAGWYSSSYMESYMNKYTIQTQYKYQERIKKSVLLVYDPMKTSQGILSVKALRLTQPFMEIYKTQTFTKDSFAKGNLTFEDVFEEVPITIHNSQLVNAFLFDLEEKRTIDSADFERLDLATNTFLERSLEYMIDSMDELNAEQLKMRHYQYNLQRQQAQQAAWLQKRRADNAIRKRNGEELLPEDDYNNSSFKQLQEPSRLESVMLSNQINNFCKGVNQFSGNSFAKLFLFGEVEKAQ